MIPTYYSGCLLQLRSRNAKGSLLAAYLGEKKALALLLLLCVLRWNILQPRNKYVNAMDCVADACYYWVILLTALDIHAFA